MVVEWRSLAEEAMMKPCRAVSPAWRLMGADMYTGMSALEEASPTVARGVALHKLLRALTMALGGDGWLGFMGNEFGHPEWMDFPRRARRRRWVSAGHRQQEGPC